MNPLLILLIALLVISGLGLIIFILLHSGKGTGISDAIASSVYSSQTGTSIIEKNLDRITIVFAIVFLVDLLRRAASAKRARLSAQGRNAVRIVRAAFLREATRLRRMRDCVLRSP